MQAILYKSHPNLLQPNTIIKMKFFDKFPRYSTQKAIIEFSFYILLTFQKLYSFKKHVVAQRLKFSERASINQQSLFSSSVGLWIYISSGQQCDSVAAMQEESFPQSDVLLLLWRDGNHYCAVEDTPTEGRATDDYQPRAQLRKCFSEGTSKC